MQNKNSNQWKVIIGKQELIISDTEAQLIKKASSEGKTQIWFSDMMISLPHIQCIIKMKKDFHEPNVTLLPELSELTAQENFEKFMERKNNMFKKD